MIRHGFVVFFLCVLAACGRQDATREEGSGAPPLWVIENSDATVEGWLFGTIHSLPDDVSWRTPLLDDVIEAADLLVVEVANLEDEAAIGAAFAELAFDNPPSEPLLARVEPQHFATMEKLRDRARVDGETFDKMESWAAALSLFQAAKAGSSGNGVDRILLSQFDDREVLELEGAIAQLRVFDSLSEPDQRDFLNAMLAETRNAEREQDRLVEIWSTGDLKGLASTLDRGILADPELYEALLANRNRTWADRLENLLTARGRPLIGVGAAHMVGPDGLPALLAARGFRVLQIQ